MQNRRNYYRILHIQPDAPQAIIKASYRTQMQKLRMHPDLGGDEWNANLLNEAYQVLCDPDRRRAYDKEYFAGGDKRGQTATSQGRHARASSPPDPFKRHFAADPSSCPFCMTVSPPTSTYSGPGNCPGCEAPLEVAHTLRLADHTKRAIERICHRETVTVYLTPGGAGQPGMIRDLSPNGMQLQFGVLLREHQVIRLACTTLSATGRITFCNRGTDGEHFIAGLEFLTLRFRERSGTFLSVSA